MEDTTELCLSSEVVLSVLENKYREQTFKMISYKLECFDERTGLLGDHAILRVTINKEPTKSEDVTFFVKFIPSFKPSAEFAEAIGAFRKEIFIYHLFEKFRSDNLACLLDVCVPRCYRTEDNKFLILDDLISSGYRTVNKHEPLDYDSVLVILQFLAKLHASTLAYEEKLSKSRPYSLVYDYAKELEESYFNDREDFVNIDGVKASIRCVLNEISIFDFPKLLPSGKEFKEVMEKVLYKIYDLVKPSTKFKNVICHGDLWATNFLLKYNKDGKATACNFVDFQCGRYCPPAHDVMSIFYLNTTREFRKKHMYNLIGIYYSNLEKSMAFTGYKLQKLIPFEEFLASCEVYKVFGLVQAAIYFPLILVNNKALEKYFSDKELYQKALWEDRSYLVMEHKDKDENYKARLVESVQDLKDYCDYL